MADGVRRVEPIGKGRRLVRGTGGSVPPDSERLVTAMADGRSALWASLANRLGCDRPAAESFVWSLVDAGIVEVDETRDRKGDWQPIRWRLTAAGLAAAVIVPDRLDQVHRDAQAFLVAWPNAAETTRAHPVLQAIHDWLGRASASASLRGLRTVLATARHLEAGRVPLERVLAIEVAGDSKALRVEDLRIELSEAFGRPVEEVIRRHATAALAFGAFSFSVRGQRICGDWSHPWLALTEATLKAMVDMEVGDSTLVTIENLTCFEAYVGEGLPVGGIALWTGGFLGEAPRRFIELAVQAGVQRVRHWGDLDPDGLAILRHVAAVSAVPVDPVRMEPRLLDVLPRRPLTARELALLDAWIVDASPHVELAIAIRDAGFKVEQEAWYLLAD